VNVNNKEIIQFLAEPTNFSFILELEDHIPTVKHYLRAFFWEYVINKLKQLFEENSLKLSPEGWKIHKDDDMDQIWSGINIKPTCENSMCLYPAIEQTNDRLRIIYGLYWHKGQTNISDVSQVEKAYFSLSTNMQKDGYTISANAPYWFSKRKTDIYPDSKNFLLQIAEQKYSEGYADADELIELFKKMINQHGDDLIEANRQLSTFS
jgi:hypothetical protein